MPTIFLIEDNTLLRENTKLLLEMNGFEVSAFEAGPPALERLKETTPDLVLCDIVLPGPSGHDILGQVRQMPTGGDVPFVFLSALADKEHVREGMNLGADDYLTKPFTGANLLAAVRSRIELSEKHHAAIEREKHRDLTRELENLPHEIRTPLNGVIGGIQLLRLDQDHLGSDGKQVLDLMDESARRLEKTLLNYILFLSLRAGHSPARSTVPVEAGELVATIANKLAKEAGREGDLVLRTVEARRSCGNCLERITGELVSNAFKFSDPGSKVEVTMAKEPGRLVLRCRDHGCGMAHGEIAAIGPFKQFHRKTQEQQGLGLGLAICKAQVTCEGCHLEIEPAEPGLTAGLSMPDA